MSSLTDNASMSLEELRKLARELRNEKKLRDQEREDAIERMKLQQEISILQQELNK